MSSSADSAEVVVFAPCSYTSANKGDAALFHAMAALLTEEMGPVRVVTTSFTPSVDSLRYGVEALRMPLAPDSRLANTLYRWRRTRNRIGRVVPYLVAGQLLAYIGTMRVWAAVWRIAPRPARRLLPRDQRALTDAIASARVVAAVPGGYLMAPTVGHYHWLYHAATLALCSLMDRTIVLLPGSYGPFLGFHRRVARSVFARCELVMAREHISAEEVLALGVPSRYVKLVADTAYLLDDDSGVAELEELGIGRKLPTSGLVGVSVMRHDFPGCADAQVAQDAYVDAVARALDWCVEHADATPVFVTQVEGDGEVSAAVIARMRHSAQALTIDHDLSPFGLKALYGKFDLMVASRIHAAVLAMAAGVPAVAIGYEHKCAGIMDQAGLGEYVVPITEPDRVPAVVAKAWARCGSNRQVLAAALPTLRNSARQAGRDVAALCGGAGDGPDAPLRTRCSG
ncbi:MAG: polysaccharide pyruvyl transferase family protein [Acidimicrobiales bacterium]